MCHAPTIIDRLVTGRLVRGVGTVSLSVLTSCDQKLKYHDPYDNTILVHDSPRASTEQGLVCMVNAATHQFSGCYHPEPQLCNKCASKITSGLAKQGLEYHVKKTQCFLCRKPGYIVK